jgi:hypothetical protein
LFITLFGFSIQNEVFEDVRIFGRLNFMPAGLLTEARPIFCHDVRDLHDSVCGTR